MSPYDQHTDFENLVTKYLANEASPSETQILETAVKTDKNLRELFYQYKQTWMLAQGAGPRADILKAWKSVEVRIESHKAKTVELTVPTNTIKVFLRVAAIFLIICAGAYTAFELTRVKEISLVAQNNVESIILDDNTRISLNRESSISYPSKFRADQRRVKLTGDAFFEVAHHPEKPFVVETEHLEVVVTGTSFWVHAHPDEPTVEVIVNTGSVAIIVPGKPKTDLSAPNRAVFDIEKGVVTTNEQIDPNFLSWKTQVLIFDNTDLNKVISTLEKTYATTIILEDEALASYLLTATFDQVPLEDVLTIIAETFDLRLSKHNETFHLSEGLHQ